jgi:hypothetical protein
MSTKNVTLHDENGNVLLPATKTSRVTDANGTNLDTLLQQAGQVKSISVNGVTQTIDANGNVNIASADGVGIASVVQTTTSSEDGGTNVITVTKTDNTTSTFSVKNGSKGSTGATGPQGERGPQGNTGVQVDSVASIIHSIEPTATYAAADVAGADAVQDVLSELTELGGDLYSNTAAVSGLYMDGNNYKWWTANGMMCKFVPITGGKTYKITAGTGNAQYTLLTSNTYTAKTFCTTFATGWSNTLQTISTGTSVAVTAPSDANYMYLLASTNGTDRGHTVCEVTSIKSTINELKTEVAKMDELESYQKLNISTFDAISMYIDGNNNEAGQSIGYHSKFIPVTGGVQYLLKTGDHTLTYAFTTSDTYTIGSVVSTFAIGYNGTVSASANTSIIVTAPSNASYIYLLVSTDGKEYGHEVYIYSATNDCLDEINKRIDALDGYVNGEIVDLTTALAPGLYINGSTYKAQASAGTESLLLPVTAGDTYKISARSERNLQYTFLKGTITSGVTVNNWATGWSNKLNNTTSTVIEKAPSDAVYLYLLVMSSGNDRTPVIRKVNGITDLMVSNELVTSIPDNDADKIASLAVATAAVGSVDIETIDISENTIPYVIDVSDRDWRDYSASGYYSIVFPVHKGDKVVVSTSNKTSGGVITRKPTAVRDTLKDDEISALSQIIGDKIIEAERNGYFYVQNVNSSVSSIKVFRTMADNENIRHGYFANKQTLYVDASNGSDSNGGTSSLPVQTIEHALSLTSGEANIVISGTFRITGLTINKNYPVRFFGKNNACIKGSYIGSPSVQSNGSWKFSNVGSTLIQEIWVNGEARMLASTPRVTVSANNSWKTVPSGFTYTSNSDGSRYYTFPMSADDISVLNSQSDNALVTIFHEWVTYKSKITSIDTSNNTISVLIPATIGSTQNWGVSSGNVMYIENVHGTLSFNGGNELWAKGTFYHDLSEGSLYYKPLDSETTSMTVEIPNEASIVLTSEASFTNITFKQFNANVMNGYDGKIWRSHQSDFLMDGTIKVMKKAAFIDCEFTQTLLAPVYFDQGTCGLVENCYIHDVGCSAVRAGVISQNATDTVKTINVQNCAIKRVGVHLEMSAAISMTTFEKAVIEHCDISEVPHSGIGNIKGSMVARWNKIHHVFNPIIYDGAGIYIFYAGYAGDTNVIENNVVYSVAPNRTSSTIKTNGIYLDENSFGVTVKNNIVYDCANGIFYGKNSHDNVAENNIIDCNTCMGYYNGSDRNSFCKNIVLDNFTLGAESESGNCEIDGNIWYDGSNTTVSHDKRPCYDNPGFANYTNHDYNISNEDNVEQIGFETFSTDKVGCLGTRMKTIASTSGTWFT